MRPFTPVSISRAVKGILLLLVSCGLALTSYGTPVPQNLGNGLNKILENNLLTAGTISVPAPPDGSDATIAYINNYKAAVAKVANQFDQLAIKESVTGKYLVDIMPNGQVSRASLQSQLQTAFPLMSVQHTNDNYAGHGVIEAYIPLTNAAAVATFNGVSSVILQLKPIHNVGAVTSQGINQHRVNRINKMYNPPIPLQIDGSGIHIGVMSDSFDSGPGSEEGGFTNATADVATGDLPGGTGLGGPGVNTNPNTNPVVVIEDYNPVPAATNEGRAMCQVVADMAPNAIIGFATADTGEVGFADNIRKLGGLLGSGFPGDVVCDDVSYLDEAMFQDGIIAQGVIDVVNVGVSYCSSAANNWGTDGYDSDFRPVANGTGLTATGGNTALAGTNIDLTGVDPALYAGGFHNFNPNPGQTDIAQLFNESSDPQAAVFQWNDPYDTSTPTIVANVLPPTTGDSEPTNTSDPSYTVTFTAGTEYVITEHATPPNPNLTGENYDAIVEVKDPNGNTIVNQDTGVDETVFLFAPSSGTYTIIFHAFATSVAGGVSVPTRGHFTFQVDQANGIARITQDFNLLFFSTTGQFLEAVASNNIANNRPYEIWVPDLSGQGQVQLVISRSNTAAPANAANHFKYVFFGNGLTGMGPAEYNSYLTPVTFGHSAVAGANSVAAYAMFRPNLPEDFTSPGPVVIYFDTNNNRLAAPQLRLKPDIAAADGANNTFFPLGPAQDAPWDVDTQYANFYGTSCASPHAAAVAALIIQAHGGPHSLSPAAVKTIMQLNTFPHDLDPYFVSGTTPAHDGTITVTVTSDNDSNTGTGSNDPNAWVVTYTGSGHVKELDFGSPNTDPHAAGLDGGNPTGGNYFGGAGTGTSTEYSDFLDSSKYNYTPGMVFNSNTFVQGSSDVAITPAFANPPPARPTPTIPPGVLPPILPVPSPLPTPPTVFAFNWQLKLTFPSNDFTAGKKARFDVGRYQYQDATAAPGGGDTEPNPLYGQTGQYSADILGSGVLIPEYADNPVIGQGMIFSGIITDGGTDYPFTGRLTNKIGKGYTPLDGYGFVNAQAAATGVLPTPGVVSRKVHGTAGTFDVPLPFAPAAAGIECRVAGASNSHTLVYTFDREVQNPGSAAITQGTADPNPATSLGPEPNQVTVNLTGVTDKQHLIVTLSNVLDSVGNPLAAVPARMDVLLGDTSANLSVNSSDISQTQAQSGKRVTSANFREDVTANGSINSSDISLVQSRSGQILH
jgi:hypothetical protein